MMENNDRALVVEGGAMRGVFAAGLMDAFLECGFNPFDICIGVSAGASTLAAYLAEMPGRSLKVYSDYFLRPEFISMARFLRGGHLMDLDWMWDITIAEIRLDLERIYARKTPFIVGLTDVATGLPVYQHTRAETLEHVLKASSALPVIYRGFPVVDGRPMADGGVAQAIPVKEAIRMGARRVMVIRSRKHHYRKKQSLLEFIVMRWFLRRYPRLLKTIKERAQRYNETVAFIRNPPKDVSIVEICPPDDFRPSRLSRDPAEILEGYHQGRGAAEGAVEAWQKISVRMKHHGEAVEQGPDPITCVKSA